MSQNLNRQVFKSLAAEFDRSRSTIAVDIERFVEPIAAGIDVDEQRIEERRESVGRSRDEGLRLRGKNASYLIADIHGGSVARYIDQTPS
jgi:hypothetical protein